MPGRKPSKAIPEIKERLIRVMNRYATNIVRTAKEVYAPHGIGGSQQGLASGIDFRPAKMKGKNLELVIISEAIGKDGKSYALKQHDKKLRHIANPPKGRSYREAKGADSGKTTKGRTQEGRYWLGYWANRDNSPKYATKYLENALEDHKKNLLKDLKKALGSR